jgi:hypothetical protein
MPPGSCARLYSQKYGERITLDDVLYTLRQRRINSAEIRKKLFLETEKIANILLQGLSGVPEAQGSVAVLDAQIHGLSEKKKIILLQMFYKNPQLSGLPCYLAVMRLKRSFASECLDTIMALIKADHEFKATVEPKMSIEEYEREIYRLTMAIARSNTLVHRLQDDFEEQLNEARIEEEMRVITMLNSEKYGYILDLLDSAQKAFRHLRTKKADIPYELKDIQTLVRKLLQFVGDCGITPILETNVRMEVTAEHSGDFRYEGTPFTGENDVKNVEITSPGWEITERDIVISQPRVIEIRPSEGEEKQ